MRQYHTIITIMKFRTLLKSVRPSVGRSNWSTRERWLEEALKSISENSSILDAGAGTQQYRKFCEHLNYISQDFGESDGQGDSAGLQWGNFLIQSAMLLTCDLSIDGFQSYLI